jgi:cell division septation protein DedD
MPISRCATDPKLADPQAERAQKLSQGASRPLKRMLVGFAATVTIGLALASWYVGVRIVAANEAAPASTAVNTPAKVSTSRAAPALQPPALAPPVPAPTPVTPPPGLYLQVAGLGPRQGASFVKGLAAEGYRTRMGSATNQEDGRILIGPFAGRSALEKAERKLQSTGVLALEVTY